MPQVVATMPHSETRQVVPPLRAVRDYLIERVQAVQMRVGVDEAGAEVPAPCVDDFRFADALRFAFLPRL